MSTDHPTSSSLLGWFLGEPADEDAIEAHLFDCDACGAVLDAIHRTAGAVVALVRRGEVGSGGTSALLNRMSRDRLNVRHYVIEPGETVLCTVGAADDFMAGRFVLPGDPPERVDMLVLDAEGHEMMRVDDIVVDVRAREAIFFIPAGPVKDEPSAVTRYVLVRPGADGDHEIARYTMDHAALRDGG